MSWNRPLVSPAGSGNNPGSNVFSGMSTADGAYAGADSPQTGAFLEIAEVFRGPSKPPMPDE